MYVNGKVLEISLIVTTIISLLCYVCAIAECVEKKKGYKLYLFYFGIHVLSILGFVTDIGNLPLISYLFQFVMTVILFMTVSMRGDYPTIKIPPINKKIKIILAVFVLAAISVLLIKYIKKMNTEFEWYSAWEAPEYYPVELLNGAFILEGEGEISLLSRWTQGLGWGEISHEYGGKKRPVPVGLYVYWYSFTEDKFYEGAFELPRDTMLALFREGFNQFRAKNHTTYQEITVGIAPGGIVSVWLSGNKNEVEIGYFKGKEANRLSWEHFDSFHYRNYRDSAWTVYRQDMLRDLDALDHLKQYGIQFGLWDTYRKRFNFHPVMVYEDTTCITDEIYMEFYNGERESLSLERLAENPFAKRARVKYIQVYWSFGQTIRELILEFDEQEMFEAYEKIYEGNPDCPIELQICFDKENHYVYLFLVRTEKDNFKRIQLRHAAINWYPVDERKRYRFEVFKQEE